MRRSWSKGNRGSRPCVRHVVSAFSRLLVSMPMAKSWPSSSSQLGDFSAVKKSFMKSQRTRQPTVTNANTTIEPLSWNPSETQLLDARKFTLNELALIFGLDPSWLGASQTSRVYSNIEQEAINLVKFSLGGHLARFEQELSRHFPRGTRAKANLDALLRSDTLSRYQAHKLGIDAGFLTDDEARALEGRAPLTDEQRRQIAGDAIDAVRVRTIGRHFEIDHRIAAEHLGERLADARRGGRLDDAVMVVAKLKLAFGYFQVVFVMPTAFDVRLPARYFEWMRALQWLNLEWASLVVPAECVGGFASRLLLQAVSPLH